MANKINEIIDVINSGATGDYDTIVERLDTIDSEIDVSSEFPNQKINDVVLNNADNIDALYQITETEIGKVANYVNNWQLVGDTELSSILTAGKLNTDILICIGNTSNEYADYIEGEQIMYLPKGASAISRNFTFMFGGHWYPESEVTRKCNLSRVYLRGSDFTSVDAHQVNLYVVIYDFANGTWSREQVAFERRDYSSHNPYLLFYKRVMNNDTSN